jgi:hypothetical protein
MLMQLAVPKVQVLSPLRAQMMLGTQSSNSMDMIGKAGSLRFEKIATQIQLVAVEASLVVGATEVASVAEAVLVVAADSAVVGALEVAMVEEVATVALEGTLLEAALGLRLAALAWKHRTLPILSPTLQHREARRIRSSTCET